MGKKKTFDVFPGKRVTFDGSTDFPCQLPGHDSSLVISPRNGIYPGGWVHLKINFHPKPVQAFCPCELVVKTLEKGKELEIRIPLKLKRGNIREVLRMPDHQKTLGMRLVLGEPLDKVRIEKVEIIELGPFELGLRLMRDYSKKLKRSPRPIRKILVAIKTCLTWNGLKYIRQVIKEKTLNGLYESWYYTYYKLRERDRELMEKHIQGFDYKPLLSVILPVYNTPEVWLRRAIDSVRFQIYPHWELCIADDFSMAPHVRAVLEEYAYLDKRVKLIFREKNGHISAASNSAISLARGDFIAFLDHDDEFTEHALYMIASELNKNPALDLLYSDEDKIDEEGNLFDPHFKSDWNPDIFYSFNLITHLAVYRTSMVHKIGGLRLGYEGSQDYDLALRFVENIPDTHIMHIPHVLYHWRAIKGSVALGAGEKDYAHENARRAIREHFQRIGVRCEVARGFGAFHRIIFPLPETVPMVSLIIPTRDRVDLVRQILNGILHKTDYPYFEILILNNQSIEEATKKYFQSATRDRRVRVLDYDSPFNYSAMNNLGVSHAKGSVIGLLNNDLKVMNGGAGWLREMVTHALRPDVGAVGAKLYYRHERIQHAGVILGIGGVAGHSHKNFEKHSGFIGRTVVTQNLSAVTGACMVLRKAVFEEVGGLDHVDLKIAFNDIDLCLKIRKKGYRIVFTPWAELYHLESATRGSDELPQNRERFQRECQIMIARWGDILKRDPYYNPNLTLDFEDFRYATPPRTEKPWENFH